MVFTYSYEKIPILKAFKNSISDITFVMDNKIQHKHQICAQLLFRCRLCLAQCEQCKHHVSVWTTPCEKERMHRTTLNPHSVEQFNTLLPPQD